MPTPVRPFALLLLAVAAPLAARAQCGSWLPTSVPVGTDSTIFCLYTDDPDGPGPLPERLLACGSFTTAGLATNTRGIAAWDGSAWTSLGTAPGGTLFDMTRFDPDGPGGPLPSFLAVAGDFFLGTGLKGVAAWDGAGWQVLTGLIGSSEVAGIAPSSIASYDPDGPGPGQALLIAGGSFSTERRSAGNRIAAWNGAWFALGSGMNGRVDAVTEWDPDGSGPALPLLIAGGNFTTADGLAARNVAQWNGVAWSAMADGYPSVEVNDLMVWDLDGAGPALPVVLAAGRTIGVRAWDGSAWTTLPGSAGEIDSLAEHDPDGPGPALPELYAAGDLIHRWNGASFIQIGDPGSSILADARGLASFDGALYTGGTFETLEGLAPERIARWDGAAWSTLTPTTSADNGVDTMTLYDADGAGPGLPVLIAGGRFTAIGGLDIGRIAAWNGVSWSPLGPGLSSASGLSQVSAVGQHDPDGPGPATPWLIAGGRFDRAGAAVVPFIAAWDGAAWQSLGTTALPSAVSAVCSHDADGPGPALPQLYAGGSGVLYRLDGTAWTICATMPGTVQSMLSDDPDGAGPALPRLLIGAGSGGRGIYEWTGSALVQVGSAPPGNPGAFARFDPDGPGPAPAELLVGGSFLDVPDRECGMLRWDGEDWEPMLDGPDNTVQALTVFDADGPGPQPEILIAAGSFRNLGEIEIIRGIAGWSGGNWFPVAASVGSSSTVISAQAWDPDGPGPASPQLAVGGIFITMDSLPALRFCTWEGAVGPYVTHQPGDAQVEPGDTLTLHVGATAIAGALTFQWSKDGLPLADGGNISGATSDTLVIAPAGAFDSGVYTCLIEDDCNHTGPLPSRVLVLCPSDINRDGLVDFGDYLEFLSFYDTLDLRADLNGDGAVDFADYLEFLLRYEAAC